MGLSGLEPPTSRLSGVRSNHLSYEPLSAIRDQAPDVRGCDLQRSAFPLRPASRILRPRFPRGGDERVRTDDPLLAKQVLSQLSYTPILDFRC